VPTVAYVGRNNENAGQPLPLIVHLTELDSEVACGRLDLEFTMLLRNQEAGLSSSLDKSVLLEDTRQALAQLDTLV
jgi:hypothetical protein